MDHQAEVNGKRPSAVKAVSQATSSLTGMAHDVVSLAELHCELLAEDAKEAVFSAKTPAMTVAVALVVLLAALPVALLGVGYLLAMTGMPVGLAVLLTALVAMVAAVIAAWAGWRRLRAATDTFQRSANEFRANVAWVKQNLTARRQAATSTKARD